MAATPSYEDFEANRIKHLEMLQAVIGRLAGNSFLIKGWALTLTGVFLGFAVNTSDRGLAAAALVPIATFWIVDTYYLRAERLFRALYGRVARLDATIQPFFMAATADSFVESVSIDVSSWWRTMRRLTLAGFYGLLIAATLLIVLVEAPADGSRHRRAHSPDAFLQVGDVHIL
jgi:hypothetical protein